MLASCAADGDDAGTLSPSPTGTVSGTGGGGATGGGFATGGDLGTGGAATGGVAATGGAVTGGLATGGDLATGGLATGGDLATGGAATGGDLATGGTATGGAATGGAATGGAATGGAATGGAATGGAATGGTATGGSATGGSSSLGCVESVGNQTLIADMGDTRVDGQTYVITEALDGRSSTSILGVGTGAATPAQASDGGATVLRFNGTGQSWGHAVAVGFSWETPPCYDASTYSGISFRIRGSVTGGDLPGKVRVAIITMGTLWDGADIEGGKCTEAENMCSHPAYDVTLNPNPATWTDVTIPWASFAVAGWAWQPGKTTAQLVQEAIEVDINVLGTASYDIYIDDLEFID